jgi:hypothetical protein
LNLFSTLFELSLFPDLFYENMQTLQESTRMNAGYFFVMMLLARQGNWAFGDPPRVGNADVIQCCCGFQSLLVAADRKLSHL